MLAGSALLRRIPNYFSSKLFSSSTLGRKSFWLVRFSNSTSLKSRLAELKRATLNQKPEQSALCVHAMEFKHNIDWINAKILKVENNYSKRLVSEAWGSLTPDPMLWTGLMVITFHKFITYCFSNFHAKLFFYRLCSPTSTLVNSFHLIVIVLMTQQFTIFLSYFLLYHNQFSLRSATILLFSAGAGFSTLAPVILKKLGVNCWAKRQ